MENRKDKKQKNKMGPTFKQCGFEKEELEKKGGKINLPKRYKKSSQNWKTSFQAERPIEYLHNYLKMTPPKYIIAKFEKTRNKELLEYSRGEEKNSYIALAKKFGFFLWDGSHSVQLSLTSFETILLERTVTAVISACIIKKNLSKFPAKMEA